MLSKKIDRAMRICGVVRDFRSEVESEMCDGDDIWEEPYARHHLFWIACSEVAAVAGVRAETVSRQFVTGFGEDEDAYRAYYRSLLINAAENPEQSRSRPAADRGRYPGPCPGVRPGNC